MPSKKDILDQIAALQAEADQMGDEDNEYEVEIWNEKGEGTRLPHGQASSWLRAKFPELFPDPDPDSDADPDGQTGSPANKSKPAGKVSSRNSGQPGTQTAVAGRYFGKRPAGK